MCTEYTEPMEYSHVSEFVDAFGIVLSYDVRLILAKCKWNLESVCRFENSSVRTEYTE